MKLLPDDIKKQWIDGLRSGKYPQTTGSLYTEGSNVPRGYCCLGVLGSICGMTEGEMQDVGEFCDTDARKIPQEFLDADGVMTTLIDMNDGNNVRKIEKHSFLEIADYIEKNL